MDDTDGSKVLRMDEANGSKVLRTDNTDGSSVQWVDNANGFGIPQDPQRVDGQPYLGRLVCATKPE